MKKKIVIICLGILYVVFLSAPGVFASNVSPTVETHTQDQIRSHIQNSGCAMDDINHQVSYQTEPVQSAPYELGRLSSTTLQESLASLNNIRYVAGLNSVTLDDNYIEHAQGAAFICSVNNRMAHEGHTKPEGMTTEMFTTCSTGANKCNLGYGYRNLSHAILYGWPEDSDDSNIDRLGHRRWVLNPTMGKTGFGSVSNYYAMYATDGFTTSDHTMVAWPAQQMPIEYIKENPRSKSNDTYAWSLSTGSEESSSSISVTLTRQGDGKTWSFSQGSADGYFNVNNQNYGQKGCIIFCPNDVCYKAGDKFHVKIDGSTKGTIEYDVEFFALVPIDEVLEAVIDQINALPYAFNIQLTDADAISSARAAYDALTEAQKAKVTNLSKLTDAEAKLQSLQEKQKDQDAADAVIARIAALPASSAVTLADAESIAAARTAYDALTSAQKKLVTNLSRLTAAENSLKALTNASGVIDMIKALPEAAKVKLSDETAIKAARSAYDSLTAEQKKKVTNLSKLTSAEKKIDELKAADVTAKIKALPAAASIKATDKAAITAARSAYNELTSAQKKLVTAATLKILTDAEEAFSQLVPVDPQSVTAMIEALPGTITAASAQAVKAAREAYNSLTAEQKQTIPAETLKRLEDAEAALAEFTDEEVEQVIDLIKALPTTVTLKDAKAVADAREAYEMLTEEQQYEIDDDLLDRLLIAEETIEAWEEYDTDYQYAIGMKGSLTKVKALKGKKVTLTWKQNTYSGYVIWYSTSSSFKKNLKKKKVTIPAASKCTLKNLKKGKTYYFKIRPYAELYNMATDEWSIVNGKWSKVKKVKIRK